MNFSDVPKVPFEIRVNARAAANLERMAQSRGVRVSLFVQQLFDAGYAARCAPTGDKALDDAVRGDGTPPNVGSGAVAPGAAAMARAIADKTARSLDDLKEKLAAALEREGRLVADMDEARAEVARLSRILERSRRVLEESDAANAALAAEVERLKAAAASEVERVPSRRLTSSDKPSHRPKPAAKDGPRISAADAKVARGYAAAGWTPAEIAKALGLSAADVRLLLRPEAR